MVGISGNNNIGGSNNISPFDRPNNSQPVGNNPEVASAAKPQSTDIIDNSVATVSSLIGELEKAFGDNSKRLKMKQILLNLENNNTEAHRIRNQKSVFILASLDQLNISESGKLQQLIDVITVPVSGDPTKRQLNPDPNNPAYKLYAEQLFPKAHAINSNLNIQDVQGVLQTLSQGIGGNLKAVRKKIMEADNLFERKPSSFKDILSLMLNSQPDVEQEAFLNSLGLSSIAKGISVAGVSSPPFSAENPSPFSIDNPVYGFLNRTAARQMFDAGEEGIQPAMQRVLSKAENKLTEFIKNNFTQTGVKDAQGKEIVVNDGELERAKALLLEDARRVSKEISELFKKNISTDKNGKVVVNENIKNLPAYQELQEEFVLIALKVGLIDSSNTLFSQIASLSQQADASTQFGGSTFKFNKNSLLDKEEVRKYGEAEKLIGELKKTETEFQEATTGALGREFENLFPDLFQKIRRTMPYDPIAASNTGHQFDYEITLVGTFFARKTMELYQETRPESKNMKPPEGGTEGESESNIIDPVNLYNIAFNSFGERFKFQKEYYDKQREIANNIVKFATDKIKLNVAA